MRKRTSLSLLSVSKLSKIIISLFCVVYSCSAISSLRASSTNSIQGDAPSINPLSMSNVQNYFGIKVGDKSYSFTTGDSIFLSLTTTFNDVSAYFDASSLTNNDIIDKNGDVLDPAAGLSVSNPTLIWKDKNGTIIPGNSTNSLGGTICNGIAGYPGPYKVTIKGDLVIKTQYGLPRETLMEGFSKDFTVNADDGFCFARPNDLYLVSWVTDKYGSDFVDTKGFSAYAAVKFPTMAFPGAKFKIVPLKAANQYTFSLVNNPNDALAATTATKDEYQFGTIASYNRPAQGEDYTIRATNNTTGLSFDYTFQLKPSRSWFVVQGGNASSNGPQTGYPEAISRCGGVEDNLPTRLELTNSAVATSFPESIADGQKDNGYKRTIGESLSAEWGRLQSYGNNWQYWFYWTKDAAPSGLRYGVGAVEGNVTTVKSSYYHFVCVDM